jgi:hypothetical protein
LFYKEQAKEVKFKLYKDQNIAILVRCKIPPISAEGVYETIRLASQPVYVYLFHTTKNI